MAQFIPFCEKVKVRGEVILAILSGLSYLKDEIVEILRRNNIDEVHPAEWYKITDVLNTFKEIDKEFGSSALFSIGESIPDKAIFPSYIKDLKEALEKLNTAYSLNHKNGEIGYYKLLEWNEQEKKAYYECKNPYPCHFDRGILTKIANNYIPTDSKGIEVLLDISRVSRLDGAESSYYIIKW